MSVCAQVYTFVGRVNNNFCYYFLVSVYLSIITIYYYY